VATSRRPRKTRILLCCARYTNIYDAFQRSVQEITAKGQPGFKKVILLMTDGRPNIGITTGSEFVELAQNAVSADAVVYTIGLGSDVPDPVNATLLQDIANAGKRKYYFSPTSADLKNIYLEIAKGLEEFPARNVRVTESLPTSIVTYNNDATNPPNSTTDGNIFWQIPLISAGTSWSVKFTVTAQRRVSVVQSLSPTNIIYDRGEQVGIQIDLPPGMAVSSPSVTQPFKPFIIQGAGIINLVTGGILASCHRCVRCGSHSST